MSSYTSINPLSLTQSMQNALLGGSASTSTTNASNSFSSLLTGMMGSSMSGLGSSGMDSMSLIMAPLLITLIEKLIELELDDDQTSASAGASGSAAKSTSAASTAATASADIAAGYGAAAPKGRPIGGVVTQYAHAGHMAYDFGIAQGTQVRSTMDGKVVYAGWNNEGYGNLVIVENGAYRTYYAHLSQIPVSVGQEVKGGQVVGLSGNTGNSTGPHLHYEVRKNMVQQDPTPYLS